MLHLAQVKTHNQHSTANERQKIFYVETHLGQSGGVGLGP